MDTKNITADEVVGIYKLREAERILKAAESEVVRAQRHHEVFLATLQSLITSSPTDSGSYSNDVAEARRLADLAYPKPDTKP